MNSSEPLGSGVQVDADKQNVIRQATPPGRNASATSCPCRERTLTRCNLPSLQSAPADVAARKALRPADLVNGSVSARLRLFDVAHACGDAEHATSIGENAGAVAPRAGMKDLHVRIGGGAVQPLDLRALLVGTRIAARSHDHAKRRVVVPVECDIVEA